MGAVINRSFLLLPQEGRWENEKKEFSQGAVEILTH